MFWCKKDGLGWKKTFGSNIKYIILISLFHYTLIILWISGKKTGHYFAETSYFAVIVCN